MKEKDKEIERLKNELEVSRNNEETYRLEMLDITKRLGLDEETLFDDVKDKAERLNNKEEQLIRRLEDLIIVGEQVENEWAVDICKMIIEELKGSDKE